MNYDWNFSRLFPYVNAFFSGTLTTLSLTFVVIILGTVLGIFLGFSLRNRVLKFLLYPIVDIIRALPPLVLILFMYYFLTRDIIGYTITAYWVCIIAMSINLAAFTSDLVRAAIENVPVAAIDAGKALGMNKTQINRFIIFPHMLKEIIPGMTLLYIAILKMSSLASIINVREVVYAAQTVISAISRSLEAWIIVGLIYIIIVIPLTYLARWLEKKTDRGQNLLDL